MKLSMIAAIATDRGIGFKNQMLWHLPADFKHFKQLTMRKPILMGRLTFESIGKALPGRRNIVISRQAGYQAENVEVFSSIEAALTELQTVAEVMVIGGANIYSQCLPKAQRLYLTFVHAKFAADAFFPDWSEQHWQEIQRQEYAADENNPYAMSFVTLAKSRV